VTRGAGVLLLALAAAAPARAACPDIATVARFGSALLDRRTPAPFGVTDDAEARCAQDRLVALLAQPWGDVSGHAVAADTTPPLRGALYFATLRERSGATIDAGYAARPAVAPGLLLHIGAGGQVEAVSPYLALLDLAAMPGDGVAGRIAGNLGLRLGVVGPATLRGAPVDAPPATLQANGAVLAGTLGLATSPAGLMQALARGLAAEDRPLRPGETVALLGPAAPVAPRPGETWRLSAEGLGAVAVSFR
jgi:2-keto-4-pentenoate hydratase